MTKYYLISHLIVLSGLMKQNERETEGLLLFLVKKEVSGQQIIIWQLGENKGY